MKSVLSSFLFFLSTAVLAQTAVDPTAPQALADEIVVTASALPETIESTPAAVTVITRQDIERRSARDIADVLREVPGLSVSRTGSSGKATSLFTRGAGSTHTMVLWNGIEIDNPYFAGYDWGRFSTVGVEQIEVVRGPYSALYGSDAVAGVVNILTAPKKTGLRGKFETGGRGLRNESVEGSWVGSVIQAGASYEHRNDDGIERNDDFSQNSANGFARWNVTRTFSLGVAARQTTYGLGVPLNLNADGTALVPSINRRQTGSERQLSIPIQQTMGRFGYEVTLAESRRRDDFRDPDDPYGYISGSTTSRTRRARLSTHTVTTLGTIVIGGEYERAVVDDVTNFGPNLEGDRRLEQSFFIEDRLSRELASGLRLELSLGVRRDRFDTFGSQTSPRVAGAVIVGAAKVRAAFGGGFRAPSIGELYFPFSGNRDLRAEHSRSGEVGIDYVSRTWGTLSATLFRGQYRDLITFDNKSYAFANIGRATTQGVELGWQHETASNRYSSISYTYLPTAEDGAGARLARRPKGSGSITVGARSGSLDSSVTLVHAGAREDVLPVYPFSPAPNKAYTTIDANIQWHLGRIIPYAKLENLTNRQYEEVLGYRSPGRRAIFGVRVGG
ncbi:MAG: TonB-dependent receptor [Acidobacteriota bacterium]